ncbi:Phospholipid-transporting ATPase 2 [Camellia lanceoleosa]|uniref:Phospholipid-transporting ATPase 2 n=1 Tax=Camellia lanceoleosa TaxID=1840588 RepID=A0ACC0H8I3_9ERIC|nr:Phospholipid-transporting ATPase 2 [Camellia lanceoleosa]
MDAMIDKLTGAIFIFQMVVVIVLGIAGNVWKDIEARKLWYVQYPNESPWYEWVVIPLRFELLCSIMIPISIKVSLDLVKSLYARFIDWDNEMIDLETGTPAHAANTAISEDLGQVEYIMTDKTGTLTENKMIFRRCYINGIFYGASGDALKDAELINAVGSGSPDVVRFFTVMAICNTAIPMQSKSGSISYKVQSQDEDALVRAASCLNIVFFNKNANILEINFNRAILQYDVLDTLEFTSDRKRMYCKSGKIILLSKGADEAILPYARAEPKGQLLLINGKTEDEVSRSLERVLLTMRITNSEAKDVAFVIGGWALEIALKDYKKAFTELAILSRTAICCRVTPSQKAQLVELLKSCDYRTLAIGDGGNDVRMIQQADIGVGISGREGLQAARAADYSIGKFRFLQRLILVHGRPFTILQHLAIWGNLVGFYIINWIVSGVPSSGMYTIMFRLCRQPSCWKTMLLIVAAGMGPVLALKYFRYTYRSSKINILQQAERLGGPILSLGNIEPQLRLLEKDVTPLTITPLSITQPKNRNPVYEPLLSDSPNAATRRSFGSGTQLRFLSVSV